MSALDLTEALRESAREPARFVDFYRGYFDEILAFFARRTGDPEVALDLTAESFAQAFVGRRRFKGGCPAEAEAWLYKIARRQVARYLRRGRLERTALEKLGIEIPSVESEAIRQIERLADIEGLRSTLRAGLNDLPATQREAIQLRVVDELPYAAIAERLKTSEVAVRLRVSRGLNALAEALEDDQRLKELIA